MLPVAVAVTAMVGVARSVVAVVGELTVAVVVEVAVTGSVPFCPPVPPKFPASN